MHSQDTFQTLEHGSLFKNMALKDETGNKFYQELFLLLGLFKF